MKVEAVDVFCGVGGLTYGLREAGINVLAGLDNDASCAEPYEKNNKSKFIEADVQDYDFSDLAKLYSPNSIKVLVGCAPCQPFSTHTHKSKQKDQDTRWNLIDYFLKAVKAVNPEVVSMENVRGITRTKIFEKFISKLEKMGYKVEHRVVYCPNFGIPQSRSRLVLLASKLGDIGLPTETHTQDDYLTVEDIIGHLPKLKSGEICESDSLHRAKNLYPLNIERIKQSKPNGTWRDWDKSLLPECYKKESGRTYSSVYGRMDWQNVAPTMTTQFYNYGSGRFGHPQQDRALSLREGALLQTFPPEYFFGESISMTKTGRHIGNAVPPRLGYVIGCHIKKHLLENIEDL